MHLVCEETRFHSHFCFCEFVDTASLPGWSLAKMASQFYSTRTADRFGKLGIYPSFLSGIMLALLNITNGIVLMVETKQKPL